MSFALDLSRMCAKAGGRVDVVVRKVIFELFRRVILRSPVDTGRFRGNWYVGIGAMNGATDDGTDKTGAATVSRVSSGVMTFPLGQSIWLTNSLPYAQSLEYGYSKQAPAGMVRLSVAETTAKYGR